MLKRERLSIRAIGELTGYDRETVRKYLLDRETSARKYGRASWKRSSPFGQRTHAAE
jgi:hypothetical protein